jgi:hypothetical protein
MTNGFVPINYEKNRLVREIVINFYFYYELLLRYPR